MNFIPDGLWEETRYVGDGGSWWYDKVKRMLISCISAAGKIYIQVKISEQDCALLGRID